MDDLHPKVAELCRLFLSKCKIERIDVLVTSTYRDHESQEALYAQGRTKPGMLVTNAKGGYSFHNWRVAFDVVLMNHGKPVWDTQKENGLLWKKMGAIGEAIGLEWAGRWSHFPEFAHFQYTNGKDLAYFQNGHSLNVM